MELFSFIFCSFSTLIVLHYISRVSYLEFQLNGMKKAIKRLEENIELPEHPVNQELKTLISHGEEDRAIKKARQELGYTISEATEYVEKLRQEP